MPWNYLQTVSDGGRVVGSWTHLSDGQTGEREAFGAVAVARNPRPCDQVQDLYGGDDSCADESDGEQGRPHRLSDAAFRRFFYCFYHFEYCSDAEARIR